jgi:hypothetical protein
MCSTQNAKSMFSYKIKMHTKLDYGYVTIHRRHTFKFQHHFAVAAQIYDIDNNGSRWPRFRFISSLFHNFL